MKITKKTKINEVIQKNLDAVGILFEVGLTCVGCPMAQEETLEEGCKAHGMDDKKIKELVDKLNSESCSDAEASSSERLNK